MQILWRTYDPNIEDEVSGLLREELSKVATPKEQKGVSAIPKPTPKGERSSKIPDGLRDPQLDIAADLYERRPNITFRQLLEDNKIYQKMLAIALKRPKRLRAPKLLQVYQVLHEDLGAPKINIEICGCTICKVPLDSESCVNIMTEETAHELSTKPLSRRLRSYG